MKTTIKNIVEANRDAFQKATTTSQLRQIARDAGILNGTDAENRARWTPFVRALRDICNCDYYAMRGAAAAEQQQVEAARLEESARGHELHTLYCDAATRGGGAKIGVIVLSSKGEIVARRTAVNSRCFTDSGDYDQFAAECFGVLKSVEVAKELGLRRIEIRNDRISSFHASTRRDYIGSRYLWIARKLATEAGILVQFSRVGSEDNLADELSRSDEICESAEAREKNMSAYPSRLDAHQLDALAEFVQNGME